MYNIKSRYSLLITFAVWKSTTFFEVISLLFPTKSLFTLGLAYRSISFSHCFTLLKLSCSVTSYTTWMANTSSPIHFAAAFKRSCLCTNSHHGIHHNKNQLTLCPLQNCGSSIMKLETCTVVLLPTYIDTYNYSMSTSIVATCDSPEPFLSSCIPLHQKPRVFRHYTTISQDQIIPYHSTITSAWDIKITANTWYVPCSSMHTHNLQLDHFAIQLHCSDFLQD